MASKKNFIPPSISPAAILLADTANLPGSCDGPGFAAGSSDAVSSPPGSKERSEGARLEGWPRAPVAYPSRLAANSGERLRMTFFLLIG
jgi:hypothetical protein